MAPSAAMGSSPATRATALLTADAMPARSESAAPRIAAVRGETVSASPNPNTTIAGNTCHQ